MQGYMIVQQPLRSTLQVHTHKVLWFKSIVWVIGITKINGRTFVPLSVFHYDVMMRSSGMTGGWIFFSLKYTYIIYRSKGNFMMIKSLFETYVWKCTPGEIISKQWRHNDVTNKVDIYFSSKLDILCTARKEIRCWL